METDCKRVAICSHDEALAGALRLMLEDIEVERVPEPVAAPDDVDVLVWSIDDETRNEIESVAQMAPTLIVGGANRLIDAVDAGCRGFLTPSATLEEMTDAVRIICDGGAVLPPDLLGTVLRHLVHRSRANSGAAEILQDLTTREHEVFRLAAGGARKEEIGQALFISPATARTHLQRVYRKLGVHSQAELIALAVRAGVYRPEEDS